MVTLNSGIWLPEDHPAAPQIKQDLTRTIWDINNRPETVVFYDNIDDFGTKYILIPRYYNLENYDINIVDQRVPGKAISIKSNIIPRSESQKKSIDFLTNNTKGVLCLEPGRGKTVIAIESVCRIGEKTIIYVHKNQLITGWKNEFLKHTDISENNLAVLSSKTYKKDLEKDVILCTQQTFMSLTRSANGDDFMNNLNTCGIGVLIVDEVHSGVGPQEFTKASLRINSARTYGLSATPERYDGNTDIIIKHLGEVTYFKPDISELLNPTVYMIYSNFGAFSKNRKYICFGGSYSYSKYVNMLTKSPKYLKAVADTILKAYNSGRTVLVIGSYIKPLLLLAKTCNLPKDKVGIFMVGTLNKKDKLKYSDTTDLQTAFRTKAVIFATYSMARDGVSRDDIDCLVMTTPTANIIQAAGRILRVKDGKKTPIVVDIVDEDGPSFGRRGELLDSGPSVFLKKADKRIETYTSRGWVVKKARV